MPVATNSPSRGDRFYSWVAIGAALIVFVGFARTYFLKGLFNFSPIATAASSSRPDLDSLVCRVFCADKTRLDASG